jgi:SAM-dependent methyltransferase
MKPKHYHSIKELGIKGKRSAGSRLRGINEMKHHCRDKTVLDLGCAEGLISFALARYGCRLVHGVDKNTRSLKAAREFFETGNREGKISCEYDFHERDFADPADVFGDPALELLPGYDIVLMLGIYHKADAEQGAEIIKTILPRCGEFILFRGGIILHPQVRKLVEEGGYDKYKHVKPSLSHGFFAYDKGQPSSLEIFRRRAGAA